jgi:hypothetical protein
MDFFAETFPACGSFPTSHHQTFSYLPARRRVVPHPSGALPHNRPWAGPQTEAGWANTQTFRFFKDANLEKKTHIITGSTTGLRVGRGNCLFSFLWAGRTTCSSVLQGIYMGLAGLFRPKA